MRVRVLGAAAGGGFPQWNCSCGNCRRLREGRFAGRARSQTQLAITSDDASWFLINASPDLRYQIESFRPLHPRHASARDSPIAGIVLPSAEVDAALGLLLLRESQPLTVYSTLAVQQILVEDNSLFGVLQRQVNQVQWISMAPGVPFRLGESGLECTPFSTGGGYPGFVKPERAVELNMAQAVLGFYITHQNRQMAFIPGAVRVRPEWLDLISRCDVVFFDGTFWSDDELIRLQGSGKTARQMGHQPVEETLAALSELECRKIFIHINNTNPILDEDSDEYRRVRDAGWEVSHDGMDLVL